MEGETGLAERTDVGMKAEDASVAEEAAGQTTLCDGALGLRPWHHDAEAGTTLTMRAFRKCEDGVRRRREHGVYFMSGCCTRPRNVTVMNCPGARSQMGVHVAA